MPEVIKTDNFFPDSDVTSMDYIAGKRSIIEQSDEKKKEAKSNYDLFTSANTANRQKWVYRSWENFQFSKGAQLTREEEERLREEKLPIYVVNMITPAIEIMKYFIIANKPMWKYSAVEAGDRDTVDIFRALADYVYDLSNGQMVLSKVVLDCLVRSVGYMQIVGDSNADLGRGEVKFDYQEFDDVLIDPTSKDPFARDANFIIIAKNISRTGLMNLLPQYKKEIMAVSDAELIQTMYQPDHSSDKESFKEMSEAFNPKDGNLDDFISYFEVYRKIQLKMNNITMRVVLTQEQTDSIVQGYQQQLSDKQTEMAVLLKERHAELTKQMADPERPIIQERVEYELAMYQKQLSNDYAAFEQEVTQAMNKELYPVRNFQVDDKQLEIMEKEAKGQNEAVLKDMILEHTVYYEPRIVVSVSLGVDTFLYKKVLPFKQYNIIPLPWSWDGTQRPMSAVDMLKEKQREINKIRQIVIQHAENITNNAWISEQGVIRSKDKWRQSMRTPNGIGEYVSGEDAARKPSQVQQQQIPNSFFPLLTDYKTEFEFLSGITAHLMGAVTSGDEPYRLAMARDEFSTRRLRSWVNSTFEPWLDYVGNVFNMVAQSMYTSYKVFRITQPDSDDIQEYQFNVPVRNKNGHIIKKLFDYQTVKFDVTVKAGSTLPTNKDAWEERLYKLYKDGIVDKQYYLKHTDLPETDDLLNRFSEQSQLSSKIESLEDEIKSLNGDIETLRRQLLQSKLKTSELELVRETDKEVMTTKAQQKTLRDYEKLQSSLRDKQNELDEIKNKNKEKKDKDKSKKTENKS